MNGRPGNADYDDHPDGWDNDGGADDAGDRD